MAISPKIGLIWSMLRQRCPLCGVGRVFRSILSMHKKCPHCNRQFEREEGYFVGAMYFSYALALAFLLPVIFLLQLIFPKMDSMVVATVALFLFVPFVPVVFRYSRVLWMYFDYWACPLDEPNDS